MGSSTTVPTGLHVGMIMDGNGRWAVARGRPRLAGHRVGAQVVKQLVEAAPDLGIGVLTLYAFSADNWKRPAVEVAGLMRLFRSYLASETARCVQNGVQLKVIGRRDRLSPTLLRSIRAAETATRSCGKLLLRIAIDYSARDSIVAAASATRTPASPPPATREEFVQRMAGVIHSPNVPELDLLIRTGGEQRLSDFLLWECAYAELLFERCMWPEFNVERFKAAIREFSNRERRFGALSQAAVG